MRLVDSSSVLMDGLDTGRGNFVFGGGGRNLLLLVGLALATVLAEGGFLLGVFISGASESFEYGTKL